MVNPDDQLFDFWVLGAMFRSAGFLRAHVGASGTDKLSLNAVFRGNIRNMCIYAIIIARELPRGPAGIRLIHLGAAVMTT